MYGTAASKQATTTFMPSMSANQSIVRQQPQNRAPDSSTAVHQSLIEQIRQARRGVPRGEFH